MNNVIMRKLVLTAEYQPLSDKTREVATVEISTPPTNQGTVFFLGDNGQDVPWVPGEFHLFQRVNLADLKAKGTPGMPGDLVTVIGGTW